MALPLFASILLGTVASKVVPAFATKKLGMDPKAAAFLGMAAGFGAGAVGSGAFSAGSGFGSIGAGTGNAVTTGLGASSAVSPISSFSSTPVLAHRAVGLAAPQISTSSLFSGATAARAWDPRYAFRTANASGMGGAGQPLGYNAPKDLTLGPSTWDKLKAYATSDDSQRFLGNAASTLIEGMMQEKPKPRITGGSSGGGGGGGRMAPAYPGGGGGQQTQVVWGFGQGGGFNPQAIT